MKVVDAFWEKRNLGVDAVSFYVEKDDALDDVIRIIEDNEKEYQTAIVSPTDPEVLLELQKIGFRFIECSISLSSAADKIVIPDNLKRFQTQMAYRPASDDERMMIKHTIENGEIFKTDKISLDPFFGVKKSGIRYSYWVDDLLSSGNDLFVITFKDVIIAFEVAGLSGDTVEYYLGGMLPSKTGKMLGAAISLPGAIHWKNAGAKKFRTTVSSNNLSILKIHESFGFRITDIKYVLIRHLM